MVTIIGIRINNRIEVSLPFQEILSKYGCIIKTRIGLHSTCNGICSKFGIILLEISEDKESENLKNELRKIDGVIINSMKI